MRIHTRPFVCLLGAALSAALVGCGNDAASSNSTASPGSALSTAAASIASNTSPVEQKFAQRHGELLNPEDSAVVMLYYDLAGISPPIDSWVEEDSRVKYAPAPDKAAKRTAVRAELEAAAASVRDVGVIRLTMNSNLSEYDPAYEEFTVRALAPSSEVTFKALGQQVSLRFANGNQAQVWRVPNAQSQAIRDRIGYASVSIDALLKIASVRPAPAGGTLVTDVIEYELREDRSGVALARVRVGHDQ
jgi:hypothetical protein